MLVAVNRRQLLGASLAGIIAALSLPFERFAEWCREWLSARENVIYLGDVMMFELGERVTLNLGGPFDGINRDSNSAQYGTGTITRIDRARGTITVSA